MSDNITREPYRNAWYKQLQEEVSKITPHLVPEVENDDNGKILVAGQEGAFGWAQPPEELPVITESDEGKVLKVDAGVPKWLEDQDAEIPAHTTSDEGKMLSVNAQNNLEWEDDVLVVNVTESSGTYTADKTYAEIEKYALKGKISVRLGTYVFTNVGVVTGTGCTFYSSDNAWGSNIDNASNRIIYYIAKTSLVFLADGTIRRNAVRWYTSYAINITDGQAIDEFDYKIIQAFTSANSPRSSSLILRLTYNGNFTFVYPSYHDVNRGRVFANSVIGIEVYMSDSDRIPHVVTIPKLPTATAADAGKVLMVDANGDYTLGTVQGGSPHYAEVSLGISVE